jgi:hypothetical protein
VRQGLIRRDRVMLHAVAAVVTAVVLAPLVLPGYVLSYDMVFVPHQPLTWELIAPSAGLPRAVPQDAVVSLLSLAVPGWVLQRVALAAAVYSAAYGAGRLIPTDRLSIRIVAAVGYAWTPFLAERLLLGQWGLLLGYAALPWLIRATLSIRSGEPGALARLVVAAGLSAITPTGGLIALGCTAVMIVGRDRTSARSAGLAVAAVAAVNLPWVVAAAATTASGRSDAAGVAAFSARGENWSGPLGALAGTGGIWNAQTTPGSRSSALIPVVTAVIVALGVAGFAVLRQRWPEGSASRLAVLAAAGFVLGAAGAVWGTDHIVEWLVARVPGAGLVRDGPKFLAPYALLLVLAAALGVERVAVRLARPRGRLILAAAVVLPVALMPDLAVGGLGALRPVQYPADWDRVAEAVAARPGPVVSLPLSGYRRYGWNRDRTVIDVAPRYLDAEVVVDDTLFVGPIVVSGESPRVARLRRLLRSGATIAQTGARWALVQRDSGGALADASLAGMQLVYNGPFLALYENPSAGDEVAAPGLARRWLVGTADLLAVGVLMTAVWQLRRRATAW